MKGTQIKAWKTCACGQEFRGSMEICETCRKQQEDYKRLHRIVVRRSREKAL